MHKALEIIIVCLYSIILLVISTVYLKKKFFEESKAKEVAKSHLLYFLVSMAAYGIITYVAIRYSYDHHWTAVLRISKWLTIYWGCYLLACTDVKEKIIPNEIIATLLIVRVVFLIIEVIIAYPFLKDALGYPILGAVFGGGIIALAMIVSRHGVGAGDVKLFFAIGFFIGSTQILSMLLYTFFVSAVVGLILLLLRKVKMKDSVPLAPFAFIGVATCFCLLMIGG